MKLGILCTMINGFGRRGFYNVQEVGLGRALARMGHTVTVYKCLKQTGDLKEDVVEAEPGLTVRYIPIKGIGSHGWFDTAMLDEKLDGLMCFADTQVFLPRVYRWCKKRGIPFVPYIGTTFSVHGGLHGKIMDTWFSLGTLRIYKRIPVIAKTDGAKKELEALGVHDIRIANVGLDTTMLKSDFRTQDRTAARAKFGFTAEDVVIGSVARLEPDKRPLELIEVFHNIQQEKPSKLLLVGEGVLHDQVVAKIEEYGLQDRVRLEKRMPFADMWQFYTAIDYFVNMNVEEIFGMAVMEAVYYETPVVASMAPGPSITLKSLKGHHLCETDRDSELCLLAPYPDKKDLEESAKTLVEKFSWDHAANAFVDLVKQAKKAI